MECYEDILNRMKENYETRAGAAVSEESDIMIRLKVLAGEIFKQQQNEDFILRQLFPITASGEYLDRHAQSRGLRRKEALKAKGTVLMYADEAHISEVTIPAGTIVADSVTLKRFETDETAVIAVGEDEVLVPVTAVEAGAASNSRGGNITVLVTPVAGVIRVYNGSLIRGGTDTENDESLRQRVIESYQNISNGTNDAYYKSLAESVDGVYSAGAVGRVRGAGTVDVYVCGEGEPLSNQKIGEIQTLISNERELNVDVLVQNADEVSVPIYLRLTPSSGYGFDEVSARCRQALVSYIKSLGIGKDVLVCHLSEILYHTEGVKNFQFLSSYTFDRSISRSQYAAAGTVTISEA